MAAHASSSEPLVGTLAVRRSDDVAAIMLKQSSGSIANHCKRVRERLVTMSRREDAKQYLPLLPGLEDILDRFILWTGNMGALHPPHSRMSLDSRLSGSPEVGHQIYEQLEDLYGALRDGKSFPILPRYWVSAYDRQWKPYVSRNTAARSLALSLHEISPSNQVIQ